MGRVVRPGVGRRSAGSGLLPGDPRSTELAALLFGGPTPDARVLVRREGELEAGSLDRTTTAHALGVLDLHESGAGGPDGEEQLRIGVATFGVLAPALIGVGEGEAGGECGQCGAPDPKCDAMPDVTAFTCCGQARVACRQQGLLSRYGTADLLTRGESQARCYRFETFATPTRADQPRTAEAGRPATNHPDRCFGQPVVRRLRQGRTRASASGSWRKWSAVVSPRWSPSTW